MKKQKPKRRSLLFVPALKKRFYVTSLSGEVDTVIFDLEDSIPDEYKSQARKTLLELFPRDYTGDKELSIRINALRTDFYEEDLETVQILQPDSIMVPKIETKDEIELLYSLFQKFRINSEIILLIDTLTGLYNIRELFGTTLPITAVALGSEDLIRELGVERKRLDKCNILKRIQIEIIMHAAMYRIQCIGPISRGYRTIEHLQDLEAESVFLRELNVTGKLAIHPSQVQILNNIFDIKQSDIQDAIMLVEKFQRAKEQGTSVVVYQNEMRDAPALEKAKALLKYAKDHGYV